jgi:hypothetical protein
MVMVVPEAGAAESGGAAEKEQGAQWRRAPGLRLAPQPRTPLERPHGGGSHWPGGSGGSGKAV